MKALIQRVKWGKVCVAGEMVGEIGPGVVTLLGIGAGDSEENVIQLMGKISKLRIFDDADGKMNLSLIDQGYSHLIISQFTLYGDLSKGNRPSFTGAGHPKLAERLYERAISESRSLGIKTEAGIFQAHMEVSLLNDGPATFWLE